VTSWLIHINELAILLTESFLPSGRFRELVHVLEKQMTSDRPKKPKKPSDIAGRFRELLELRKLVHEAELGLSRSPPADIDSRVDGKERRARNASGRTRAD
jgi:hypothetical protein